MDLTKIPDFLLKNHGLYFRDFIWRHDVTPYRIMIAEFMLQRTNAYQVESIYSKFVNKYPDIIALSNAKELDIKTFTQHIGLHWRYKHFIQSACYIVEHYDSALPQDRIKLLEIPGVGNYVAGVLLTVCFNKQEFVVDSNIARFINRYRGYLLTGEIRRSKSVIQSSKEMFINSINPGLFLFALLDFTALICKSKKPLCKNCILSLYCRSRSPCGSVD